MFNTTSLENNISEYLKTNVKHLTTHAVFIMMQDITLTFKMCLKVWQDSSQSNVAEILFKKLFKLIVTEHHLTKQGITTWTFVNYDFLEDFICFWSKKSKVNCKWEKKSSNKYGVILTIKFLCLWRINLSIIVTSLSKAGMWSWIFWWCKNVWHSTNMQEYYMEISDSKYY